MWLRESEFRIVTCDPRVTVSVCGHIWLFWMTSVVGLELGVHVPLGLVLLDDELLPQETAMAIAAAAAAPAARVLRLRTRVFSLPHVVMILAYTSPDNTTARAG